MATQTTNYGLTKPSYGDNADISVINSNMDKIDAKMKEIEDAGGSGASTWVEVAEKPFETIGSGLKVDEAGVLTAIGGGSGGSGGTGEVLYHQERMPTNSTTYTITFDKKPISWVRISSFEQDSNNHNYALFKVGDPFCNFIWSNGASFSNRKAKLTWAEDMMSVSVEGFDTSGCSNAGTTVPMMLDYYVADGSGGGGGRTKQTLYTNSTASVQSIELSDSYKNYDLLIFRMIRIAEGDNFQDEKYFDTDWIEQSQNSINGLIQFFAYTQWNTYRVTDETHFDLINSASGVYVKEVIGVNF